MSKGPYTSIAHIKAASKESGSHFFDADSMKFFDSKVGDAVFGGRYFITSEQFHGPCGSEPRKWTIRVADDAGHISTVGDFQQFKTSAEAVKAARALAAEAQAADA